MRISAEKAFRKLAGIWEDDAERIVRYDPEDPKARVLEACAEEVRRVLGETQPEWVPLSSVQSWTQWSRQTLQRRCRDELEPAGLAKKERGHWHVAVDVALDWPVRPRHAADEPQDLRELARLVGRAG